MKVVLFCGGLGMRLRDVAENLPKPMVPIGYRPVLWHVMKYYAHYGHKDFILCLGYRGDVIKQYFLSYDECVSNDFVLSDGGRTVELVHSDISDWRITFADTGALASIGQRLKAAEKYLADDEVFLANYSDGLTDLPLPHLLETARRQDKIATCVTARPNLSYHMVSAGPGGLVTEIKAITQSSVRINGGYFVFKRTIFDHIRDGEDLVQQPFQRLIRQRQLLAYEHDGFFACLDTFKDKQHLEELYASGDAPWQVWRSSTAPGCEAQAGAAAPVASLGERRARVRTA